MVVGVTVNKTVKHYIFVTTVDRSSIADPDPLSIRSFQLSPAAQPSAGKALNFGRSAASVIEMLTDDILLQIFHHYLDASPPLWFTLAHVCRKWRQVVFTSPLGCTVPTEHLS